MKYSTLYFLVIIIVFCTERLEKIFMIGFFDLYPARILFIVLLFGLNFKKINKFASFSTRKIFRLLVLFLIFYFFSIFKSDDILYSLKKYLDILTILGFIVLVYNFFMTKSRHYTPVQLNNLILKYISYIVFIVFILALILKSTNMNGSNDRVMLGINIYRRVSLFLDPNFLGAFLNVTFFLFLFSTLKRKAIIIFVILLTLILTGSKASILALIIVNLFYLSKSFLKYKILRLTMYTGVVSILIFTLYFISYRPIESVNFLTQDSLSNSKTGSETSLSRLTAWSSGFQKLKENPLFGIGPGNIVKVSKGNSISGVVDILEQRGYYGFSSEKIDEIATHNQYLENLFEGGVIPFIFYVFLLFNLVSFFNKAAKELPFIFKGYLYSLSAYLICILSISYNPYYMSFIIGFILFLFDKYKKSIDINGNIIDNKI